MMLSFAFYLAVLAQVSTLPTGPDATSQDLVEKYRVAATERWEKDIAKLEALDKKQADPDHAVLMIGSSSIRLWETAAEDLAPWGPINRGYGGAKMSDLVVFTERLVSPHQFDALVIFVANDITGSTNAADKTPQEVLQLYQHIVKLVRKSHAEQPIFFISITPTSSRFKVWHQTSEANRLIAEYCQTDPSLHYINTVGSFLTEHMRPNDSLFRDDHLHLNRDGYRIWGRLVKAALDANVPAQR